MSDVATAYLQAELMDDCDEMEIEDAREQRALGAFAFLFSPEDTMVECQDCRKPVCLDIAIPSETVCAFRCEKCDVQHALAKKTIYITGEREPQTRLEQLQELQQNKRDETLGRREKTYAV